MRRVINGIYVNYQEKGEGEPLVLIHGLGSNLTAWAKQVRAFAKRYRVIAYDVRGHGQSDKPEGDYYLEVLSHDLYRLLRKLEVDKAFVVGQSMGGMIAQRFALDHGGMVRALVICDSAAHMEPGLREGMDERARMAEEQGMAGVLDLSVETALSPAFVAQHQAFIPVFKARTLANSPATYAAGARMVGAVNLLDDLPRISCPTLVLVGEHDVLTPPELAEEMSRHIPGARLKVLRAAGHAAYLEQPRAFNRAVLSFLAEVERAEQGGCDA